MNRDTSAPTTTTARVINALLRALAPTAELSVEAEMQQHFPFARRGNDDSPHARLHLPTTAHGSL